MALNEKMILASDLQSLFRDKDTGLPLSAGIINFYEDDSRSTLKPVYQLTGSAMTGYSYAALPNPITLSSIGTMQDALGNDIVAYYYPFSGDPDDDNDTVQNYYITVDSSTGVRQFTRQAWPNATDEDLSENDQVNFIPNGQFLAHLDGDAQFASTKNLGVVNLDVLDIAWGGWTQEDQVGAGGTYTSSFISGSTGAAYLNDVPAYYVNYICSSPSVGTHQIGVKWRGVNHFEGNDSGTLGATTYTLFFFGISNDGSPHSFDLYRVKYFGTGGNTTEETLIASGISITTAGDYHNTALTFGSNLGKTLGTSGDDYVQLVLRPSSAASFDVSLTDFVLSVGNLSLQSFPEMTNAQVLSQAVSGWMPTPNPDGSDLYLPLTLTSSGMIFDDSQIGKIVTSMEKNLSSSANELYCDGTAYLTAGYSSIGIPYSRLQAKLWDSSNLKPIHGTGSTFMTTYINPSLTSQILLVTNAAGSRTTPANGASSPAFTFGTIVSGQAAIGYKGFSNTNAGHLTIYSTFTGATNGSADITQHTYTQSVINLRNNSIAGYYKLYTTSADSAANLANSGGAGKYFTFSSSTTNYYIWFRCTTGGGAEIDPAPGGTGILVNLQTANIATALSNEVAIAIAAAFSGQQVNSITTVAAASITAGDYIVIEDGAGTVYNIWYSVAGAGSSPGGNAIEVQLTGSETAAQVASATVSAINGYQFAVPDLRGLFLRGIDPNSTWDFDLTNRVAPLNYADDGVGTLELDQFLQHKHQTTVAVYPPLGGSNQVGTGDSGSPPDSAINETSGVSYDNSNNPPNGGNESRPVNMYVKWFIKY